ncbi:hypothetical protein SPRG_20163 [Saprolegnia parasitica CBS 223.65]|uniref:HTH CENPB-type domain-containing protein n=1 Tax=Saprolegnia parasitica (strain CBS 223.65) TaxID=695850 RepID=A0A067CGT6_SAPPC|nr:hypothetical protein SPRG_20163 [Saprolegnia parasitica CBS 223.65]KDO28405.1 hypothetical protein SPRG_20163 [Saprolegnia parasitica CBS 223.65]|eukprot:XP_012200960.1 hypothetical protein SPRG_20163 [Saprolegnia parasitica CBS 223.65]
MTGKKKRYSADELEAAVQAYVGGTKLREVHQKFPHIPERTITNRANKFVNDVKLQKPGPAPVLSVPIETNIAAWIVEMQTNGFHVSRQMVLSKANEIYHTSNRAAPPSGYLGDGWLKRFMERHPELTLRDAKGSKRVRVPEAPKLQLPLEAPPVKRPATSAARAATPPLEDAMDEKHAEKKQEMEMEILKKTLRIKSIEVISSTLLARQKLVEAGVPQDDIDKMLPLPPPEEGMPLMQ